MGVSLIALELGAALELDQQSFIDSWSEAQWITYLNDQTRYFVRSIEVDGHLNGYLVFSRVLDEAELLRVGVTPWARNCGLAEQALQLAERQLKAAGIERLLLEVRASNSAAIRVYTKLGFTEDGRRKNYYPAIGDLPLEDALLFSKVI